MFRFRASHFVDTSVRMSGEGRHDSTVTGDRGISISDDGERRKETLRNIAFKKRRLRLHPEKLDDTLAEWIPVSDDSEIGDELSSTLDSISGTPDADSRKRKAYTSSVGSIYLMISVTMVGLTQNWDPRTTQWLTSRRYSKSSWMK